MKALIIGYGMIGKKHAEILKNSLSIDVYTYNASSPDSNVTRNIKNWQEIKELSPDFIVVCNPTFLHLKTIEQFIELNCPVFLEKPIDSDTKNLEELTQIINAKGICVYVAYCLRFNPVITFLKKYFSEHQPKLVRIYNNNNLSCWPRANNTSYSQNIEQGGGVVMDLSHEIDYLNYLSPVKEIVYSFASKIGNVTTDAPDFMLSHFKNEQFDSVVELNYFGHLKERSIKVDFGDHSIEADIKALKINFYKNLQLVDTVEFPGKYEDMFLDQWKYFLDNMKGKYIMNNLQEASNVFSILQKINRSH